MKLEEDEGMSLLKRIYKAAVLAISAVAVSFAITISTNANVAHAFTIDSASWKDSQSRLRANGGTDARNAVVNLRAIDRNGTIHPLTTASNNGRKWIYDERNLGFLPCDIEGDEVGGGSFGPIPIADRDPSCEDPQPPQVCDIGVAPTALSFGDVQTGTTSSMSTTVSNNGLADCIVTISPTGSTAFTAAPPLSFTVASGGSQVVNVDYAPTAVGADAGNLDVGSNDPDTPNIDVTLNGNGIDTPPGNNPPTARGDAYATPVGKTLEVTASRLSGVLYNDFDVDGDALTVTLLTGPSNAASFSFTDPVNGLVNGGFSYTPNDTLGDNDNDSFTYTISDGTDTATATVNIGILSDQPDFKIMMNYELGMHCTGFEFSYCCVLPPYNSILTQVVKPQTDANPNSDADFPRLLEGDPREGLDGLGRETVVRDYADDGSIQKYQLKYFHDAQPRREGQGKAQTGTLISDAEGNSLQYFASIYDSAQVDVDGSITGVVGKLVTGAYNGSTDVVLGDGDLNDATDNYANGWLNHFYIYVNADGNPNLEGENATAGISLESDKIRLGVSGHVEYPVNVGAALQPLGPIGSGSGFDNVLTFSADTGTVVYTQMKVLENLPIMLTSPRIWEALGMPLTPFEDTINFFGGGLNDGPGSVDEDSLRPFVAMKAQLHEYPSGNAVVGSNGHPVIGFGTAPIDIPNCERCHSVPAFDPLTGEPNVNSPNYVRRTGGDDPFVWPFGTEDLDALTNLEYNYWMAFYTLVPGVDSDWYPRLKGAAINMMALHDADNGTAFTGNYPCEATTGCIPGATIPPGLSIEQNTRLGHESVICQRCHADNVIAAVKSATGPGGLIPPITEAIHNTHSNTTEGGPIVFNDSFGRDGGCQGCHPAHRSDGVMDGYPITLGGENEQAGGDNRLAAGGCFVGRDVHSNPMKDVDGAETPSHMNPVGQWLVDNVASDSGEWRGIWCTNCHSQLGQEIWKAENVPSLIHAQPGDPGHVREPFAGATLEDVATLVGLSLTDAESMLDPKTTNAVDHTHDAWASDPGLCDYVSKYVGLIPGGVTPDHDGNVAVVEVVIGPPTGAVCVNGSPAVDVDCGPVNSGARFQICGTTDGDGDFNVALVGNTLPDAGGFGGAFCTTPDCVASAQAGLNATPGSSGQCVLAAGDNCAVPVPMSAATDGRDHWLAPGEPHCADCHAAPYVEQSGNVNHFPPFNYPRKASLMRYSRGHQDISCQGCHESIHGLYPVTPAIDTTSYAQAAALNPDGSHGPLKCETCHTVDNNGIPDWIRSSGALGGSTGTLDDAIGWAHTFTDEAGVLDGVCQNCHDVKDGWANLAGPEADGKWLKHAMDGRISRLMMDKATIESNGSVWDDVGVPVGSDGVCQGCHGDERGNVACGDQEWMQHLTQGRVTHSAFEAVSLDVTGSTCGW